jgi:hypothetical protein
MRTPQAKFVLARRLAHKLPGANVGGPWRHVEPGVIISVAMKPSSGGGGGGRRATPRRRIGVRPDRRTQKESVPKSVGSEDAPSNGRDTTVKSGDAPRLPPRVLRELGRGQIPPEPFAAMLDAFGELPEQGQYDLAVRIINSLKIYELRKLVEKQQFPLPYQQKTRLTRIGASGRHMLALLGIEEAESIQKGVRRGSIQPTVPTSLLLRLYDVGVERRPTATASAEERMTTLLILLSDLVEAAKRCALETGTQYRPGRGGSRREGQITAEVQLVQAFIASYAELCNRFRNSGPPPAGDKSLRKFVRSGLKLVAFASHVIGSGLPRRITDDAIRAAFDRWRRAQSKA